MSGYIRLGISSKVSSGCEKLIQDMSGLIW